MGKVEGDVVGMLSVCNEDGAAHEVINGDRLVLGTLNGDAEML